MICLGLRTAVVRMSLMPYDAVTRILITGTQNAELLAQSWQTNGFRPISLWLPSQHVLESPLREGYFGIHDGSAK